jgi:hypothetical protein
MTRIVRVPIIGVVVYLVVLSVKSVLDVLLLKRNHSTYPPGSIPSVVDVADKESSSPRSASEWFELRITPPARWKVPTHGGRGVGVGSQ